MVSTFGLTSEVGTSELNIANAIRGSKFTIPEEGVALSITAYIKSVTDAKLSRCAIYDASLNLVEETEEKINAGGLEDWVTFDLLTNPTLSSSTAYWLVVWGELGTGNHRAFYKAGDTNQLGTAILTYDSGGFPSSISPSYSNFVVAIYCTYELPKGGVSSSIIPLLNGVGILTLDLKKAIPKFIPKVVI